MNKLKKYTALLGAGAIMITLATGCANKDGDAVPDATENVVGAGVESTGNVAGAAADATGNMAGAAADATGNMADTAGNNLAETAEAAGNVADAAGTNLAQGAQAAGGAVANVGDALTYTPKIKTALAAQPALNGSKIDVDTLGDKKEIVLRGTVTSAAQKTMAEAIAKKSGPEGFTVVNQLTMGGKM